MRVVAAALFVPPAPHHSSYHFQIHVTWIAITSKMRCFSIAYLYIACLVDLLPTPTSSNILSSLSKAACRSVPLVQLSPFHSVRISLGWSDPIPQNKQHCIPFWRIQVQSVHFRPTSRSFNWLTLKFNPSPYNTNN